MNRTCLTGRLTRDPAHIDQPRARHLAKGSYLEVDAQPGHSTPRDRSSSRRGRASAALALVLAGVLAWPALAEAHRVLPRPLPKAQAAASARAASTGALSVPLWCGNARENPDISRAPKIKLVYALPQARPNRFVHVASILDFDVKAASVWVAWQSGWKKTLRFDMATNCGAYIDLQFLPLRYSPGRYESRFPGERWPAGDSRKLAPEVAQYLRRRSFRRSDAVLVFADYLQQTGGQDAYNYPGGEAGEGALSNVAFLYGPDQALNVDGYDDAWTEQMLHELFHVFGAVSAQARHYLKDDGHCSDGLDVMCYDYGPPYRCPTAPRLGAMQLAWLDCGRDDYFSTTAGPRLPGRNGATVANTFYDPRLGWCADPSVRCLPR